MLVLIISKLCFSQEIHPLQTNDKLAQEKWVEAT